MEKHQVEVRSGRSVMNRRQKHLHFGFGGEQAMESQCAKVCISIEKKNSASLRFLHPHFCLLKD